MNDSQLLINFIVTILAALIGYSFLKSQGSISRKGITIQPYPNTPEGRRKRKMAYTMAVLLLGAVVFTHFNRQNPSLRGLALLMISAALVVLFSIRKGKNRD